jgi:hypothetical protein
MPRRRCRATARLAQRCLRRSSVSRAVSPVHSSHALPALSRHAQLCAVVSCAPCLRCLVPSRHALAGHDLRGQSGPCLRGAVVPGLVQPCHALPAMLRHAIPRHARSSHVVRGLRCDVQPCLGRPSHAMPAASCDAHPSLVAPGLAKPAAPSQVQPCLPMSRHAMPAASRLVRPRLTTPCHACLPLRCLRPGVSGAIPVCRESIERRLGQLLDTRHAVLL